MKATLIECPFGIFAFNDKTKMIEKVLFPKNPQSAAKNLAKLEAGKPIPELSDLINSLKNEGYDTFVFENEELAKQVHETMSVNTETAAPSHAGELLRSDTEKFALETGFVENSEEFGKWMHDFAMEVAKLRVKKAVAKRDLIVAQAIQTLDEVDKTINTLMARVREWYGIHFPELDRLLDKQETYARLVVNLGSKDNFNSERLAAMDIPETKAEAIVKVAEKSMGADLAETDLEQIQALCKDVIGLYHLRQDLEKYLDLTMEEVAPNTKSLVGSLLGARLIALAGGLMNLAKRPASTIQVLGAEKALFRSLKSGTRPPKHGLIFQHTLLHDAKRWQRGKIARAIAGKLAIAVRADAFGGRYIGDELEASLDKRIEEIRQKYDQPPLMPVKKPKTRQPEQFYEKKWGKRKRER